MQVRIIGDTHIGKRFPYTTAKSALAFQQLHRETLEKARVADTLNFQLGDLFDGFSVSGESLIQGYNFTNVDPTVGDMFVIAGNHDKSNNTDKSSAVHLLMDNLEVPGAWETIIGVPSGNTYFVLVPHQLTQEDFEAKLVEAARLADSVVYDHKVLLLHCNYGNREGNLIENYLRPDRAKELLESFDYIFSGHEHNMSSHFGGRLVMLGSILPFSFGEMTDKYVMDFDADKGSYELIKIWDSHQFSVNQQNQFVEMTGSVTVEEAAAINKQIAEWYKSGDVIAVKNGTTLIRHEKEVESHVPDSWLDLALAQCNDTQANLLKALVEECK